MKHFDYKDLCIRLMNNDNNIRQVLDMTREYLVGLSLHLDEVRNLRDPERLCKFGHSIKGIASSASMYKLAGLGNILYHTKSTKLEDYDEILKEIKKESNRLVETIDLL